MNRKRCGMLAVGLACVGLGWMSQVSRGQQVVAPPLPPPEVSAPKANDTPPPPPPVPSAGAPSANTKPLVYTPVDATTQSAANEASKVAPASFTQSPAAPPTIEVTDATGKQEPGVSIEWVGTPNVRLNIPATCQILVKNTSQSTVHQVTVSYPLPEGVTVKGSEPRGVNYANVLTWSIGTLQPGQTQKIDLQVVAAKRGDLTCNATESFSGSSVMKLQVREPKLAMKLSGGEKVTVGDSTTINFVLSNPGDGTADGVKVRTQLPEGLEHARGRVLEFDVGSLAPQESRTVSLVCNAKSEGVQSVPLLALAEGSLTVSEIVKIDVMAPAVDVAVTGPKLRYLDRHAVFNFKVTNPSKATASKVVLTDVLPAGFKFHAASQGGKFDPNTRTVSWTLGDLPPGQSKDVALDVIASSVGEHKQVASASAARGTKQETQLVTKVEGIASLLIELADVDDPVEVGTETCYEIRVVNTGTKMETNLQVSCTIPDQMEFINAKCASGARHTLQGRELTFEPVAKLAPKADVIYRVLVKGKATGDLRFRTRVSADGLSQPVLREESTRVYGEEIANKQ